VPIEPTKKTTVMLRNFFGQLFALGNGSGQRRCGADEFEAMPIQQLTLIGVVARILILS
jgi:hypothetical protein